MFWWDENLNIAQESRSYHNCQGGGRVTTLRVTWMAGRWFGGTGGKEAVDGRWSKEEFLCSVQDPVRARPSEARVGLTGGVGSSGASL
jgi:hypothetical protein